MYYKLICILYALLCGQNFILVKSGCYNKQGARNFKPEIIGRVKEEVDRLLQAGFIQSCHYADWVSNIVLLEKKNTGKIWICMDFRNLNHATPKDEYPTPVADLLVDSTLGNKVISFLDGNAG
jgi:hypothetical protein